jgi:UDP-N-acetylglucosamine 2-epimerase (non-hydrolysing)
MTTNSRLAVILGIRPDVIRASLIVKNLKKHLGERLHFIWSGQHYSENMKDIFFQQLDVPIPDEELAPNKATDTGQIGSLISALGESFARIQPDAAVFLGDTNTVVGSLAAAALNIPVVHIEGCMRSYDWRMPEEKYRTTIDHLSDVIYAYLPEYKEQGIIEGINPDNILVTGNPIVDVIERFFLSGKIRMAPETVSRYIRDHGLREDNFHLMTCHRRENVESPFALGQILELASMSNTDILFPAGYRTQQRVKDFRLRVPENVMIIDPISYSHLLELMIRAKTVITDSGTIVEEAAVLKIPSIQMRTSTERPQVYDSGGCVKFDPHVRQSPSEMRQTLESAESRLSLNWEHGLGDGQASERIVSDLLRRFEFNDWNGHEADSKHRPVDRNFGFGKMDLGRP